MDALTSHHASATGKVAIEIDGMSITVPTNTTNVYLARARIDPTQPHEISGSILTTDLVFAWTWLIEGLADGGWGDVVAYDAAIKSFPRWCRNLGRIDGPTKHPHPLRHTPTD